MRKTARVSQDIPPARRDVLEVLADLVPSSTCGAGVLVAIDGVDGAGKTRFADDLAAVLAGRGRPVIRASVDDFHRPRKERYRRGARSPLGYWLDSYDYDALRDDLLDPLGPGGSRRYRTGIHDVDTDEPLCRAWLRAPAGAVLCLDGIFLHRDELCAMWDLSVFLDVPVAVSCARLAERDGANPDPSHPQSARYVEGQRLYLESCRPAARATVVIDNSDWRVPVVVGPPER